MPSVLSACSGLCFVKWAPNKGRGHGFPRMIQQALYNCLKKCNLKHSLHNPYILYHVDKSPPFLQILSWIICVASIASIYTNFPKAKGHNFHQIPTILPDRLSCKVIKLWRKGRLGSSDTQVLSYVMRWEATGLHDSQRVFIILVGSKMYNTVCSICMGHTTFCGQ